MARSIDTQQSAVRGFVPAQNDEERFLMRHVEDLARAAFGRGIARYSAFLSDREQQLAQAALNRAGGKLPLRGRLARRRAPGALPRAGRLLPCKPCLLRPAQVPCAGRGAVACP